MTCLNENLSNCLGEEHVFVGMLFQHPLQKEWSPGIFELSPILLDTIIEIPSVGSIPNRLDVEFLHLLSTASVNATVIQKQVQSVVPTRRCSDLLKE